MSVDNLSFVPSGDQAARWAVRLHEGELSSSEREEFQRWVLASEDNANELRAHSALLQLASRLSPQRFSDGPPAAEADSADTPPVRSRSLLGRIKAQVRMPVAAVAAATLLAAGTWFFVQSSGSASAYVTRTGEMRAVTFEDGSVAYMNTRTQLQWKGDKQERRVELLDGEALFDVVREPNRPFRVMLENSDIQVLGTRFNVYRKKNGEVIVTVLEGSVRVREYGQGGDPGSEAAWERELHANEQIAYRSTGLMRDVHTTIALNAIKWREGILEMRDEALPDVLDELTRYTDRRIVISDPRLAELRLGGALSLRDVRVALGRIQKLAPVAVKENGSTFTLDYRDTNSTEEKH